MKNLSGNSYNSRRGIIEGDHHLQLVRFQFGNLIERANSTIRGDDLNLVANDLPSKVTDLMLESRELALQLERCDEVDIDTAISYATLQGKLAAKALPLLAAELGKRQKEADDTVLAVKEQLTGKSKLPLLADVVAQLMDSASIIYKAEHSAKLPALKTACGIVRDIANSKTMPRYLTLMKNQHMAATLSN
jgi:hypothetical protein